jgi:anhydro-N-acetylmuramic acid kinase
VSNRIREIAVKKKMRVAGLMSGTSVDGVDVAIVDITGQKVRLLAFDIFPYPPALRREILRLCRPESARLDDICHYNFVLAEVFLKVALL